MIRFTPPRFGSCTAFEIPFDHDDHILPIFDPSQVPHETTTTTITTTQTNISTMSEDVEELERQILEFKKLAVARKREGDIENAKQALLQAKRLQLQLDAAPITTITTARNEVEASAPADAGTHAKDADALPEEQEQEGDASSHNAEDDHLLDQLENGDDANDADEYDVDMTGTTTSFSLAEMMDVEMMTAFASGGLTAPSLDEYQTKMDECKQSALTFKQQGKTEDALQQMRCFKQLQVVYKALEPMVGSIDDAGTTQMGSFDQQDTEEDKALLRELMMDDDIENRNGTSDTDADDSGEVEASLEFEDLIHMDVSEVRDAVAIGMKLPPLEKLQQQVEAQRGLAIRCKQAGDLEGAKAALAKFKTWSQHMEAIEPLMQGASKTDPSLQDENDDSNTSAHEIRDEDLEKLLISEEKKTTSAPAAEKPAPPDKIKPKSSEELRQEAIRLRDEKKITEAAAVLKLYKEAVAREAQEEELRLRKETIERLQVEIHKAQEQQHRFTLFQRLIDADSGTQQIEAWRQYADRCSKVAKLLEAKETKAITVTIAGQNDGNAPAGTLRRMPEEDLAQIIQSATDPSEARVEISILDFMELHKNKSFQTKFMPKNKNKAAALPEWLQLEAHVSIQLPLSESESDKPIDLHFRSPPFELSKFLETVKGGKTQGPVNECEGRIDFWSEAAVSDPSASAHDGLQYVTLARGDSKLAKSVIRRMERRKINIALYCHPHANPSPKSGFKAWFKGGSSKKENKDAPPPVHLGKIILETKDLLDHGCIVGELDLLGNAKKLVGGKVRLCIRTGVPFDGSAIVAPLPKETNEAPLEVLPAYTEALKFSVNKSEHDDGDSNGASTSKEG